MSADRPAFAIVGFGEAGAIFGGHLVRMGCAVAAFDRLQAEPGAREGILGRMRATGVRPAADQADAARGAGIVLSTVTAAEAVRVAEHAAPGLRAGQVYLDLNSVRPEAKRAVAEIVGRAGAEMVEGVAMDTVPLRGAAVPLLLCGAGAADLAARLGALGLSAEAIGPDLGLASRLKLLRSILVKGMEALFAEAMEAAGTPELAHRVADSLTATHPGLDWRAVIGHGLSRSALHGARRAAEMRECAAMLEAAGVEPLMAMAIAARQDRTAERALFRDPSGASIEAFLKALRSHAGARAEAHGVAARADQS